MVLFYDHALKLRAGTGHISCPGQNLHRSILIDGIALTGRKRNHVALCMGAILQETMRIYPPVYALPRIAIADSDLGGYPISRGTVVIASISGIHDSPAWGEDRNTFRPERFLSGDWPRRAYMPYGAGRHLCIGSDFANVEIAIVLSMILQRYNLQTPTVVEAKARVTQVPDRSIKLYLTKRS